MTTPLLPLASLSPQRLPALAELHCATMPTLLTELGFPFVLRYYQIAQTDPAVLGFIALPRSHSPGSDSPAPVAYVLGSPHPSALTARLRAPLPWFAAQLTRLAFRRPAALLRLLESVVSASPANALRPGQIELTYIGVAPSRTRARTGQPDAGRLSGRCPTGRIHLRRPDVETDNQPALALYHRFGFAITATFREGRYHRHRMERPLG